MHYHLQNLHLKTRIRDIIEPLTVIEEQIKKQTTSAQQQSQLKNKHLKNPCRLHGGNHEWNDCRQNPKNAKSDGKDNKTGNSHSKNESNGRSREHRRTEQNNRSTRRNRSSSSSRGRDSDTDYEINRISEQKEKEGTPSSEILIALPKAKNSKKYTTYLGLIDSGSSGSLLSSSIIENTDFNVEKQKKPTKWDTATGVLLTTGKATIEALNLP